MRSRLGNVFGHGDSADPQQAAHDAAERAQYEASVRSAQQRVHATMEGDPRVRQFRQEARNADFDRMRAEGERAARQIDAVNARNDARLAHEAVESLRQRAERLDPTDPHRNELMERARRMEAEAAHHEARGQQAEARAQQAEQRLADAQRRIGQANQGANEITRAVAGRRRGLWRWANVEAESQFRMVGPEHPGPRVSALTGRDVPPPVWSNRPYESEGGLRHVLHVDQARLEGALSDGRGGFVRTPDPKGGWLRLLNAFGLPADPTRGQNCLDTVASLFDTFVHGRPTVAAPRTYDGYANGNGGAPVFGERGGPGRMEDLTGGRYQALVGDLSGQRTDQVVSKVGAGFEQLHQQLIDGGHGSFASIITGWRGGGSHAWAAVNHEGVVHFIDPQQGKVVIAEPHGGGLRFVDPATGHEVPHPIFDPAGIKAMDALVVDGQARPMPFGDRPAGMWNERPLTAEYLSHQPQDVRSAQTAEASHRAVLAERNQAVSDANQARSARQDAAQQAADAQAHQTRAQEAARQAGVQQGQRDAAWDQANQQRGLAHRHDEAVQHYAQRLQQGGSPQELHDAATRAQQHHAAAEQARAHETRLRNEAYQHENARQQAESAQRYWDNEATQAQQRGATATQAADWFEQQARVHEHQATQRQARHSQDADRAADDHHQEATRYRQEAARYQQEAARYQTGDPRQEAADRMRQHYERLAHSAEKARDGYRMVHRLEESAQQRDLRAEQHEQQADAWRRHAVQQERLTTQHEQARVDEEARASARFERAAQLRRAADELTARGGAEDLAHAAELRRQADEVQRAGEQHRAEAATRQQARDTAADEAQRARKIAQAADAAAAAERTAAAQERQAAPNWQHSAKAWHDHLRGTRAIDPSAQGGSGREFRPESLRHDLRARFEALTDPKTRAAFETKFHQARGDEDRLGRALDNIERNAAKDGHTLEHALAAQHERDLSRQADQAAIPEPPEDVKQEIRAQLDYVETVRARIDSYQSRHPEVDGTDRWRRAIESEAAQLERELRGEKNPSVQKALDHGNNVRGVESEIALAERSRNVTEVAKPITVKLKDGRVLKTDVDVVADNGKRWIWRDSKDYHSFGVTSSDFKHAREQVTRQLEILLSGEYHKDGGPPRLEWHFPRGVDAAVADALEAIRVTDPVTGRQARTHVYVVGDRLGGERTPDAPEPPGAEAPGAPPGHQAEQLFSREAARTNLDVLLHGTDVPHNLEAVHHVAELIGVDLSGVRVELVVDPEEIRYLDAQGAAAYTPVEKGGTEIRLGPASFADPETLAATVAHEFTHVEQLRSAAELSTATRGALEDQAYASEEPALAVFRSRFHGWGEGVGGEVLDRDGLRPSATERATGLGEGDGGGHLGGDGAAGGEHGHSGPGTGRGVREPDGPENWQGDAPAGARADEPGGAGPGADRPELTGGEPEPATAAVHSGHWAPGHEHHPHEPGSDIDPEPPANQPHPWPVDPVSGYVIQARDLEFLGLTREQVEAWMAREAPLGMTREEYRDWRINLLEALRRDGVSVDGLDIRLRGSGADFFSGVHKKLPTVEELADNPEAQRRLIDWLGDDPDRPTSRPYDSMYRLGLDEPSDFDLNLSSGEMFDRARRMWDPDEFTGPLSKDHGYLNKDLVRQAFPHLYRWSEEWSARTGREMSYAVFDQGGPADMSHLGFYVHFRDSDWVVQRPTAEHGVAGDVQAHDVQAHGFVPAAATAVDPDALAERAWSRALSDEVVSADGQVTSSEVAKTMVIRAVSDRITAPLDKLVAAAEEPHVEPALVEHIGDANYVLALKNPRYPSMGGKLLHVDEVDPARPEHAPDRLFSMADPGAERLVREMAVSEIIMAWAHDSNGTNVRSLAIQEAAVAEFGLHDTLDWSMSDELRARVDQAVAEHGAVYREILRAQYDLTQQELARYGVNDLILYRAYHWPPQARPDWSALPAGSVLAMPGQRPLSAWTGDRQIGEDWLNGQGDPGVIIAARVPQEAILAFPRTGIGCLWQREFVVLAGGGQVTMDVVHESGPGAERQSGDGTG